MFQVSIQIIMDEKSKDFLENNMETDCSEGNQNSIEVPEQITSVARSEVSDVYPNGDVNMNNNIGESSSGNVVVWEQLSETSETNQYEMEEMLESNNSQQEDTTAQNLENHTLISNGQQETCEFSIALDNSYNSRLIDFPNNIAHRQVLSNGSLLNRGVSYFSKCSIQTVNKFKL